MAKFTDLRIISTIGGDPIEAQFDALAARPDVIIATPGRLMHHLREISTFKLKHVKYLVFDEADRLFEMGVRWIAHWISIYVFLCIPTFIVCRAIEWDCQRVSSRTTNFAVLSNDAKANNSIFASWTQGTTAYPTGYGYKDVRGVTTGIFLCAIKREGR